jgi:RNA polymerase sigma-70 factor (ECF subfamily)
MLGHPIGRYNRHRMTETSPTLLDRLRRPDNQAAWAEFVQLYTPLLYHWVKQMGLEPVAAEDLVQDVFLNVLRAMPQFQYDSRHSFRAWLCTLARNKFRDARRKHAPVSAGSGLDHIPDGTDDQSEFDEAEYRTYLTERALQLARREFAPGTWQAFWGTVVEGRPANQVANECGLTPNAVYLARGRVLRRLRESLEGLLE